MAVPAPPPAPSQGNSIHLRRPTNGGERRLIADIQAAVKSRNDAMMKLARANRRVATAERGLRDAGMITGVTQEGQAAPEGERP